MSENMPEQTKPGRWQLIRDIAAFQVKLLVDSFRDLVLVPISLVIGLLGVLKGGEKPGVEFYNLLKLGRRSERWINLFSAASHHDDGSDETGDRKLDIDTMMSKVEDFLVEEYRSGGVTAQAKARLDKALDSLAGMARRGRGDSDSGG